MLKYRQGGDVSDSVGLLISILVRYPEVGTLNYDSEGKHLRFTFILNQLPPAPDADSLISTLRHALELFNQLEGNRVPYIRVACRSAETHAMVELVRDVDSLSLDEISLFIELLRQHAPSLVVAEEQDPLQEEEQIFQEELIGHMLESLRKNGQERGLIAFREEGRVFVFNK